MRSHRVPLTLLLALVAAVLLVVPPAAAELYPPAAPDTTVSNGAVAGDGRVTFSGDGYLPGEGITIDVRYDSGSGRPPPGTDVTADSNGSFAVGLSLTQPGTAVLTATGRTSGHTSTSTVQVAGSGSLAVTGGDDVRRLGLEIAGAVVAIVLGAALVRPAVRRRRITVGT